MTGYPAGILSAAGSHELISSYSCAKILPMINSKRSSAAFLSQGLNASSICKTRTNKLSFINCPGVCLKGIAKNQFPAKLYLLEKEKYRVTVRLSSANVLLSEILFYG
jgi:hypothetical protein